MGIEIILKRRWQMVSVQINKDGRRARVPKSLLCLETSPAWVAEQTDAVRLRAGFMAEQLSPPAEDLLEIPANTDVVEAGFKDDHQDNSQADSGNIGDIGDWEKEKIDLAMRKKTGLSHDQMVVSLHQSKMTPKVSGAGLVVWLDAYANSVTNGESKSTNMKAADDAFLDWQDKKSRNGNGKSK